MLDIQAVRSEFPILQTRQNGHPLVYLDNAATLQMPEAVLRAIEAHYHSCNSNVHRGVHTLSRLSTEHLEQARSIVADWLSASPAEIIFTSGTTDSLNQLARMLEGRVHAGQQILVSAMEHHSNLLPWQDICRRTGAKLQIIPVDDTGALDLKAYRALLQAPTALVAVTWVSNVTGAINPVGEMAMLAHGAGALLAVDGAQGMKLGKPDVRVLDCDFLAFSGHKLGALTGIGVLYGKRALLETLCPVSFGGGMIESAGYSRAVWAAVPQRFEAGTPNYVGAISLGAAITALQQWGIADIARREQHLTDRLADMLREFPNIRILPASGRRSGAVSFYAEDAHAFDIGVMLDTLGIAVRTGHMCAQPFVESCGASNIVRVSPAFYNTEDELEQLCAALRRILPMLRRPA